MQKGFCNFLFDALCARAPPRERHPFGVIRRRQCAMETFLFSVRIRDAKYKVVLKGERGNAMTMRGKMKKICKHTHHTKE
jgi:hypothetical protein